MSRRIAVIGAGINGLAVARQVMLDHSGIAVTVFEKEANVAQHQSSHNSGVVHAGLYYEPGSLKARLCTRGAELIRDYCVAHALPYDECGKLVVALKDEELPRLEAIHRRSIANGVPGVSLIGPERMREIEPNGVGIQALHSPRTTIVSYEVVARRIAAEIKEWGASLRLDEGRQDHRKQRRRLCRGCRRAARRQALRPCHRLLRLAVGSPGVRLG